MESNRSYRIFPIIFISFFRVCISFTLEIAIPLYYVTIELNPFIIGIISSGTSMIYLFSPILLRNLYLKIGIRNSLLISATGTLIIQIIFQISLFPWLVFTLLIIEGLLIGLFWPILITSISILTKREGVCENEMEEDKIITRYNLAWNAGAVFSYLVGTIVLFIIEFLQLIFIIILIYSVFLLFFTFFFEDPKENVHLKTGKITTNYLQAKCEKENINFPTYIPLSIIAFYGFLIGALILLYPIKSDLLGLAFFTTFLLNFFRMTAQTISISKFTKFSIKKLQTLFIISLPAMLIIFILMGILENLIVFSILFISFGLFGSILYTYSFKLTIYKNIGTNSSKYSSYFETSSGIGFFISPIICGLIADINVNLAFYFVASIIFIMLIFSIILTKKIEFS